MASKFLIRLASTKYVARSFLRERQNLYEAHAAKSLEKEGKREEDEEEEQEGEVGDKPRSPIGR